LECVLVDAYKPELRMLLAKLHIQQPQRGLRILDVRPSDAVTLATVCSAPIFVSDEVAIEYGLGGR
jgi:bifunctional DNase/RNase